MTTQEKETITKISKEFACGMDIQDISGTSWLVVDPLSAYLNFCGHENKLSQIPHPETGEPVLIMEFSDGSFFIPAGADLKKKHKEFENWQWI